MQQAEVALRLEELSPFPGVCLDAAPERDQGMQRDGSTLYSPRGRY